MILIDGGIVNPIPLNRVERTEGDILMGVDVSGHDYKGESEMWQILEKRHKHDRSLKQIILDHLLPDGIEFNYVTLLTRTSDLMIRQNSLLMTQLMNPDILLDIQLKRYSIFDFDKSEKLIAIGRNHTRNMLKNL